MTVPPTAYVGVTQAPFVNTAGAVQVTGVGGTTATGAVDPPPPPPHDASATAAAIISKHLIFVRPCLMLIVWMVGDN